MMYKITNNLVAIDPNSYLTPMSTVNTRYTNTLQYKLYTPRTNYFPTNYSLMEYNTIHYTVSAGSLEQFKTLVQNQNF